jgi:hypothetical protein
LSDLKTLNPEETIEALPPDDGSVYLNSTIMISAAQAQRLPNGKRNPNWRKKYTVRQQIQNYDSLSTDSSINPIFSKQNIGFKTVLSQDEVKTKLAPENSTTDIENGLYD